MDWKRWMEQRIPSSPVQRGGAAVWPKGGQGLIGDSLGPEMHLHQGASEIFYFVSGRCRLEVGDSEIFFEPGDFVLLPPAVPHNLWNAGGEDLLVFWIVAPNFAEERWQTGPFPPELMRRRAVRARVEPGAPLPGDRNVRSEWKALPRGEGFGDGTRDAQEAVVYIVEGRAEVKVGDRRRGLSAHELAHVPQATSYTITAPEMATAFIVFKMPGG